MQVLTGILHNSWQIVKVESGYYKLINRISGKVLDNKDNSTSEGNLVIQYSDYAATSINQQWRFIPADIVEVNLTKRNQLQTANNNGGTIYNLQGQIIRINTSGSSLSRQYKSLPYGVYIVKKPHNRIPELRCILKKM